MTYETNYLEHHGIKGQKWGLRRFQNEDGTLTAEGRDHYDVGGPIKESKSQERARKFGRNTASVLDKKPKNTDGSDEKKDEQRKNKDRIKKALAIAAAASLTAVAAYAASKHIKTKANSILDHEHSVKLRSIENQHRMLVKTLSSGGYDRNTVNAMLDNQRRTTNANFNAQMQYRDQKRNDINRSTREALRFIRSRRQTKRNVKSFVRS